MGTKSPFFRAWFGDWRENDTAPVTIANKKGSVRGTTQNKDTGWDIQISGKVFNETKAHTYAKNKNAVPYLDYINSIVENAILLDTSTIPQGKTKSQNSALMHSMYAIADTGDGKSLIKMYVEELNDVNRDGTIKRSYQLQNIANRQLNAKGSGNSLAQSTAADSYTVSDLFGLVKSFDKNFKPKSSSIYIAFNSDQVKSATDNIGTFDKSNPDIRYSINQNNNQAAEINVNTDKTASLVKNLPKARKSFIEYARNNFPQSIKNVNTDKDIGISRKGIDKFLSGNISAEKLASGYEIPNLIKTAQKVGEASDRKGRDNISGYEYYYNTLNVDGNPYVAHIRVRNTQMGDKYYGHTVSSSVANIEIEPLARTVDNSTKPVNASDSTYSISETDANVNSNSENNQKYSLDNLFKIIF